MARLYEVVSEKEDYKSNGMLDMLVDLGYLRRVESVSPVPVPNSYPKEAFVQNPPVSGNKYLNMHSHIETVMETIAKDILGFCDDRKEWEKTLKQAVKDHGHDEIITSFESWCEVQTPSSVRKPVKLFLTNVSQNVNVLTKPLVTNPALTRFEIRAAEVTDNKVFFTGVYRLQLAALLREHGEQMVEKAFVEFYQNLEEKSLPWAAKEFLSRGPVIIAAIQRKEQQAQQQKHLLEQAYSSAASEVAVPIEEDEEL